MGGDSSCKLCSASPAFARTGVYFSSALDLQVPTAGWPLVAARVYNTASPGSGLTGPGWVSNLAVKLSYSVYLYAAPSTYQKEVDIRMPDSRLLTFTENPDGVTYTPPFGRRDILVKQVDGSWVLTLEHSRAVWLFNPDTTLTSITDEYGNAQTWSYDASGRVQRVTDVTSGRTLDAYYGANGRLSAVQEAPAASSSTPTTPTAPSRPSPTPSTASPPTPTPRAASVRC